MNSSVMNQAAPSTQHRLPTLTDRAMGIRGEGALATLTRALALDAQGMEVVHLEIGQPDLPTPEHIVQAAIDSLRAGRTGYGPPAGLPALRQQICEQLCASQGICIDSDRVVITAGAKAAIFLTILATVEDGDEVILPDPGFPTYAETTRFAGGVAVPLPLRIERGFRIDFDELRDRISDRTKLIIVNSPGNPAGNVLDNAELEGIAELAQAHDLWVLADDCYSALYYAPERPVSLAALPGMLDRTVLVDSMSKTYSMTGWRLGFGVFPTSIAAVIRNMIVHNYTCVPSFVQDAAVAALVGPQDFVVAMRDEYRARRDMVVAGLNAIDGIHCQAPEGAFYAFPQVSRDLADTARQFTDRLLENGVAVLPGTDFGARGENHFRLSFAASRERLAKGLDKIATVADSLR
ncbi:MAG: pyridoxal phosphate-dependent aminotransferase [Anaerolineae bacterium]